ncbi:unnamed protein product, partial [Callosobruchus maculatus]
SAAYSLGINYNNTKVIIVDREHDNHREIKSIGRCEVVQSFVYLGSLIDNSGSCENEIRRRIQQAQICLSNSIQKYGEHKRLNQRHFCNFSDVVITPYFTKL